jgi:endonuclease/exonuclease/phosphatase family metal-dependent hydrolase
VNLTVCSANVEHARAPWRPLADVVGWQEADKPGWWEKARRPYFRPTRKAALAVGITWDPSWRMINAWCERAHNGLAGVGPHRYVSRVTLERDGFQFALVNLHATKERGVIPARKYRADAWAAHLSLLTAEVGALRLKGIPVVVTGDFNRPREQVNLPGLRHVAPARRRDGRPAIDHILVSEEFTATAATHLRAAGSDHDPVRVALSIGAPDPEVPVTFTPEEAIARARSRERAQSRIPGGSGWCLREVRQLYGVPALYPDAASAWKNAKKKHRTERTKDIPRGVPIFWTGGSSGHGHIAISAGDGDCYTTDLPESGRWGWVRIDDITRAWRLDFVGWTEDLNGHTVWEPVAPPPAPKPEPKPEPITRGPEVDLAIIALGRAKAKPGSKRDKALAQALAAALAVPPIKG